MSSRAVSMSNGPRLQVRVRSAHRWTARRGRSAKGREWAEDWARRREAESQSMREAEWERELERELLEGSQAPGGASLEVGSTCTARTAAAAAAAFAVVSRASKAAKNVDPGETGLRARRGGFEPRLE